MFYDTDGDDAPRYDIRHDIWEMSIYTQKWPESGLHSTLWLHGNMKIIE